jgi:hypothetical protein
MIPLLLWRCPLCAADDALAHLRRRFRHDLVRCRACGAAWRVRRAPGDTFYLARVAPPDGAADERSIAAWYEAMKRTVRLRPANEPGAPAPEGEMVYLASGRVALQAEQDDPLFFAAGAPAGAVRLDKREVRGQPVGVGRLFLTDRRLAWQGSDAGGREMRGDFPLARLNSAFAVLDRKLALLVEARLYMAHFLDDSPLKWVTHLALVARQVQAETGHRIATSHF